MPYARISLMKGKSPEYLRALSDNLHRALVETFGVPTGDRFQVFHQLSPNEFVFDRDYLCGPRSDDYVLIAISAGRQRDTQVKQAFYRRLAELLGEAPGIRRQDVMVVISTTEADEWSFGDGIATMVGDD
ncbi:MAG: tautomerase family protein [Ferrovum sp.]|jgi:phenylpyruvate tautomerase PptA (4-oxalocrotonate tautomerase family)|uniref:tautomerase family protein n=1 Tax=Ferrovum sp. TaxID=2609467 RepID=UPI002633B4C0|nr:tautomerase family protein [Ferrovum sp.]MBW8065802.1 tautomerase family protein [Ferrovum sp.]